MVLRPDGTPVVQPQFTHCYFEILYASIFLHVVALSVLFHTKGEDLLHAIDLLPQKDVHRYEAAEPSQGVLYLVRYIVPRQFP